MKPYCVAVLTRCSLKNIYHRKTEKLFYVFASQSSNYNALTLLRTAMHCMWTLLCLLVNQLRVLCGAQFKFVEEFFIDDLIKWSESCSVVSDTLQPQGILQARILEWVAFLFSRGSSQPRDCTQVIRIAGRFFTSWAIREAIW